MSTLRATALAVAKLALVLFTVVASLGVALTALSPSVAGAASRNSTRSTAAAATRAATRADRAAARAARTAAKAAGGATVAANASAGKADASSGKATGATKAAAGTSEFEVCNISGSSSVQNKSFAFIEGTWTGSYYTSYSLTAVPSPGSCGPQHSFTAGSQVLAEEAAYPGVPVAGVQTSFSVTNGTLSGQSLPLAFAAVTVNAGLTVLNVTTSADPPPQTGTLELCKSPADQYVQGSFNFSVTGGNGFTSDPSVRTNQCDDIYNVPVGTVSITEDDQFPYALTSVSAIPSASLVSSDLDTQNAVVSITSGGSSTVFFTNATLTGYAKVCKTLARSQDNVLAGQTFTFSASATFDGAPITVPSSVSVVAGDYGTTTCSWLANGSTLVALPLGTLVTFTETNLPPTIQSVGTTVNPPNLDAGSTPATAQFYVGNLPAPNNIGSFGAGSVTQATFTNEAYGYVEVCKTSSSIQKGTTFQFNVAGVANQPVQVGYCGLAYPEPVGTVTISESVPAHVTLTNVSGTSGATQSGNSASVVVPFNAENVVTFNDEINTGYLKLCVAQTSSDAGLQATTFDTTYSYVHNGTTISGPTYGLLPGQCSLPIGPIPVLNSNLTPIQISATEDTTTVPNVGVANITVIAGDSIVSLPTFPHLISTPSGTPATAVINSLEGITDLTFINGINING